MIAGKAKEKQGTRTDLTSVRNLTNVDTKKELATLAGVSHDTIAKVKVIEQKAVEAEEIVETIKREARERQIRKPANSVMEFIPEQNETSAEQIAKMFNTNEKYIREAEKLKEEKPPHRITAKSDKFRRVFILTCKIKRLTGLYIKSYFARVLPHNI